MLDQIYPEGPGATTTELAPISGAYRRQVWVASLALIGFALVCLGLFGWFSWVAYRMGVELSRGRPTLPVLGALFVSSLLALLLGRALFVVKRGSVADALELKREHEPVLFAFLDRLADEAKAPRPHRVFVSPEVNASVFYDLSFKNLLFPSQKNLMIGLGLINVLNLSEIKAVLAHEFGHFGQRSMAVSRWVYTSAQVASHIVHSRGRIDRALAWLSRTDVRIAWVAWGLRLIVWSIRSLLDTGFSLVMLAQTALSREMELQADLVSVSLTGSDALIHALYKLGVADDAWDMARSFGVREVVEGRAVPDLFALQTRSIEHLRTVLDDPSLGQPPALPGSAREQHRVFAEVVAHPPKMWSTHPLGREREDNAKRRYVPAGLDERPGFLLFSDAAALRARVTEHVLLPARGEAKLAPSSLEASVARFDAQFASRRVDRRYRGLYLARESMRDFAHPRELYTGALASPVLTEALARLYPSAIGEALKRARSLQTELDTLEALRDRSLSTPDGMIRHRGRVLGRDKLPEAIAEVKQELDGARGLLRAHDQEVRSAHRAAAAQLGAGWEQHLCGLAALLHYGEHRLADLRDAAEHYHNVLRWVTADGSVSRRERKRLINAGNEVFSSLSETFAQRSQVKPPADVLSLMEVASWPAALPDALHLAAPSDQNLGDFVEHIDGWVAGVTSALSDLRRCTLDALLVAEGHVETSLASGSPPGAAPSAAEVPECYGILPRDKQRARETRLHWWDRFQLGDGLLPSLLRVAVALAVIVPVVLVSRRAGDAEVTVYNGLTSPVTVQIGELQAVLPPLGHASLSVPPDAHLAVSAQTALGKPIERFDIDTSAGGGQFFYNVAGAAPLVEWTAVYGDHAPVPERVLGNPRWGDTRADAVFSDPPASVKERSAARLVLSSPADYDVGRMLEGLPSDSARAELVAAHLRWDASDNSLRLSGFIDAARSTGDAERVLRDRLLLYPGELLSARALQDVTEGDAHTRVCNEHVDAAARAPHDLDARYLAIRCGPDVAAPAAYLAAHAEHPDHPWLAWGAAGVYSTRAEWGSAYGALAKALHGGPLLASMAAKEAARVARRIGRDSDLPALASWSPGLSRMLAFERGDASVPEPARAIVLLAQGKLGEAVQQARGDDELEGFVLRLAAASRGASKELVARALALPPERGLDAATLWPSIALGVRARQDVSAYTSMARRVAGADAEQLLRFADPTFVARFSRGAAGLAEASVALAGLPSVARGNALVMAAVLTEHRLPEPLLRDARTLLFASERPYLGEAASEP